MVLPVVIRFAVVVMVTPRIEVEVFAVEVSVPRQTPDPVDLAGSVVPEVVE